ncbi:MAG: GNAT family N-acetyltransferase, partial [Acidimicrobiia bacterium]|nr:GNAT family N-acetyltransferase [Acidimicrobiia bacterium]
SNCWCTWFLLTGREFDEALPTERRDELLGCVERGEEPGLLAFRGEVPVGWCAVGPRDRYRRMTSPRARAFKAIDDRPSWVVNCFYIDKPARGTGVATVLLASAVDHARARGATRLEGYPDVRGFTAVGASGMFVGTTGMFEKAGFTEIERRGNRSVMVLDL